MIDFLLARVKAMAESTKNKPWQHEMAFNYARRALLLVLSMAPLCQEAAIMRAEIEMAYPEFPLDIPAAEG